VNYLEPGAGVSTVVMYNKLVEDGADPEKIFATLLEPSEQRIEAAAQKLDEMGLKRGKHFKVCVGRDSDVAGFVEPGSQNIVSSVAQIHHHAYLDMPLKCLYDVMAPYGTIIIADWHNSMWEHPNKVYQFLRNEFNWETKQEDLQKFLGAYPKALEPIPEHINDPFKEADIEIQRFWKGWEAVRSAAINRGEFQPEDDILMLEGHRPVYQQIRTMKDVGFSVDEIGRFFILTANPMPLLPTSGLLYLTVGKKY
jgi:SAM-dependent methyltransferase